MVALATVFMLLGIICYLHGRLRLEQGRKHACLLMYCGIILGTIFAALSKETGLLLPYFVAAIEFTLFHDGLLKPAKMHRNFLFLFTAIIPAVAGIIYLYVHPDILGDYQIRDFDLFERLLTESRVIFYYLQLIVYPDLHELSLYHDDIKVSTGVLDPTSTLASVIGVFLLLTIAFWGRRKYQMMSFAIAWFLFGHAMESTVFALELAFEHRNYLPSYGVVFCVVYLSHQLLQLKTSRLSFKLLLALSALTGVFVTTYTRASIWADEATIAVFDLRNHPKSVASQMMYAHYLEKKRQPLEDIYDHLRIAAQLSDTGATAIIHLYRVIKRIEKSIEKSPTAWQEPAALPERFDAKLIINGSYIKLLAELIDVEIQRRLQGSVAAHRAAILLQEISECAVASQPGCQQIIPETLRWLALMEKNASYTSTSRARVYFSLAKLKAYNREFGSAIHYLDRAIATQPNNYHLLVEKVNLYLTTDNLDEAERVIMELEARENLPISVLESLQKSKRYHEILNDSLPSKYKKQ